MSYNIEETNRLIRERRSTFPAQFDQTQKVDDAIVNQILENANWAPSHGNSQPWHFVVFTGDGIKKLAQFQAELYKQEAGENFKQAVYDKFGSQPLAASHVIAICMKRPEAKKFPEIEEIEAVSCAVQNMYLTATAYGLGGYWTTGGVTYRESAKPFFGLGDDDKLMGYFFLGHVAVPSPAGKRSPVTEKITWVDSLSPEEGTIV